MLEPVPFAQVRLTGAFWRERLETVLTRTIPSQHDKLREWTILDSAKLPSPPPPLVIPRHADGFSVQVFWDSDIGKWIEAASYALAHRRDADIEARIEAIVDDLERAQAPDGYLNCWYLCREPENRWTNLRDNHELYNLGHLLEGAVAYWQVTGRDRFLNIMWRYIDHVRATFGRNPGQKRGYDGHPEVELALVKLYRATGDRRALDLASYFVDERGAQPHYFDAEAKGRNEPPGRFTQKTHEYSQSHKPVREQTKVVGHAVRAMYLYTAMADLAGLKQDTDLKRACETLWDDLMLTKMYVTGGLGPSASNEGFTRDYDLPNGTAYAETCAAVALIFWARAMWHVDPDGRYADVMELALYNGALVGLSREGSEYFYANPLESDGTHGRWTWHHCPCCTMNVSRLVASVGGYAFSAGAEGIAQHLYGGFETTVEAGGTQVRIAEESNYPWDGDIAIAVDPATPATFTLSLRIPSWADGATATINGQAVPVTRDRGYWRITRAWEAGDSVTLSLPMPTQRIFAHPSVGVDGGRVALKRGPLVYCLESPDNGGPVQHLRLPRGSAVNAERHDIFDGIVALTARGMRLDPAGPLYTTAPPPAAETGLTAIPYYLWANRGPASMQVWIAEN